MSHMISSDPHPALSMYAHAAETYFAADDDMFSWYNVRSLCEKFGTDPCIAEYLERFYASYGDNAALTAYFRLFYYTVFTSGHEFSYISDTALLPRPECDADFPGAFDTVIALTAIRHLESRLSKAALDVERFSREYIRTFNRFSGMNLKNHGSMAITSRNYAYFLHGYARPELIQIGRLSYEYRPAHFAAEGIAVGDKVISVHIPAYGPLYPEAVEASFREAGEILPKLFDVSKIKGVVCFSWLLDEQLNDMLRPDSNILAFQKRFDIVERVPNNKAFFELIFERPPCPLSELTPRNKFQRRLIALHENGGTLYDGCGVLRQKLW